MGDAFEVSLNVFESVTDKLTHSQLIQFLLIDATNCNEAVGAIQFSPTNLPSNYYMNLFLNNTQKVETLAIKRPGHIFSKNVQIVKKPALAKAAAPVLAVHKAAILPTQKQLWTTCILDGIKLFTCALCVYKTKKSSDVQRHCRAKHSEYFPSVDCTICDYSTTDKQKLKSHYMNGHKLPEVVAKAAVDATHIGS